MKHDSPLVSVIAPSYNHDPFIEATIKSVLNQTYPKIELLIMDDGSTDNTPVIIKKWAEQYPEKITSIIRNSNKGVPIRWNELLALVKGEFLIPFASDDLLPPTAVEKRVQYLREHPDVDVLVTDFDVASAEGEIINGDKKLCLVPQFKRLYHIDLNNLYTQLLLGNFLPGGAISIRLERITKEEVYQDPNCPNLSDYELWLRLSFKYKWAYLPESTWTYRWHGNNFSSPTNPKNSNLIVARQMIYILSKQLLQPQSDHQRELTTKTGALLKLHITSDFFFEAQKLAIENKISEAIEMLSQIIQIDPNFSPAFNEMGICYVKVERYRLALQFFMKAVRVNPANRLAVLNLGELLMKLKQFDKGIRITTIFLKNNPKDVDGLLLLAKLYSRNGNSTKSLEIYQHVLTIDPYNEIALKAI